MFDWEDCSEKLDYRTGLIQISEERRGDISRSAKLRSVNPLGIEPGGGIPAPAARPA
jgi:hypothetical protein